jgi:hypothetical protein
MEILFLLSNIAYITLVAMELVITLNALINYVAFFTKMIVIIDTFKTQIDLITMKRSLTSFQIACIALITMYIIILITLQAFLTFLTVKICIFNLVIALVAIITMIFIFFILTKNIA